MPALVGQSGVIRVSYPMRFSSQSITLAHRKSPSPSTSPSPVSTLSDSTISSCVSERVDTVTSSVLI